MKYPPLFKRVPMDPDLAVGNIAEVQQLFETFWREISKKLPRSSEKTLALRRMQESCHYLCRAMALAAFRSDDLPPGGAMVAGHTKDLKLPPEIASNDNPGTVVKIKQKKAIVRPVDLGSIGY